MSKQTKHLLENVLLRGFVCSFCFSFFLSKDKQQICKKLSGLATVQKPLMLFLGAVLADFTVSHLIRAHKLNQFLVFSQTSRSQSGCHQPGGIQLLSGLKFKERLKRLRHGEMAAVAPGAVCLSAKAETSKMPVKNDCFHILEVVLCSCL